MPPGCRAGTQGQHRSGNLYRCQRHTQDLPRGCQPPGRCALAYHPESGQHGRPQKDCTVPGACAQASWKGRHSEIATDHRAGLPYDQEHGIIGTLMQATRSTQSPLVWKAEGTRGLSGGGSAAREPGWCPSLSFEGALQTPTPGCRPAARRLRYEPSRCVAGARKARCTRASPTLLTKRGSESRPGSGLGAGGESTSGL